MDSEHTSDAGDARDTIDESAEADGAGVLLRQAREELGLDLTHIAAETRIPLRHLEAIEAGDFESLPSRAYAIGFSRTYAKAVRLDDERITAIVRAELADGTMRRSVPAAGLEPGDPAKLPSAGLAWAGAFAALILAIGMIAFYNAYFAAGSQPASLVPPDATASPAPAGTSPPATGAPDPGGEVVLTAVEDVWVRIFEQGGDRLLERELVKGERFALPPDAIDPRINTGRPDLITLTIGGRSVPKLADTPVTLADAPVSARALLARADPQAQGAAAGAAAGEPAAGPARRPARRSASSTSADPPTPDPVTVTPQPTTTAPTTTAPPTAQPSDPVAEAQ
jgi:hypothetical protein